MDIVYKYDGEADALAVYFKELGRGEVTQSTPLTQTYDAIVDFVGAKIALLEFLSPTKVMGVHFRDTLDTIDEMAPFDLQARFQDDCVTPCFVGWGKATTPARPTLSCLLCTS